MIFLRGKKWDIIHAWDSRPAVILPALYARALNHKAAKLVLDWCDWFGRGGTQAERPDGLAKLLYGPVETFFEEAFRTYANGTTVISEALRQRAVQLRVVENSIHLLPQGCELEVPFGMDRRGPRRRLGIPEHQKLLVSVGALLAADAALLFEALRFLFRDKPHCRFVLIGKHGAVIPPELKIMGQFHEAGYVSDDMLRDYVDAADGLLVTLADTLASRARWPSKVNPFLAAGRPVVITRVGDLPAMLEKEQAAVVVQAKPEAIVAGIATLLEDPAQQEYYGRQGRQVAEKYLSWPILVRSLEEFYRKLHGQP